MNLRQLHAIQTVTELGSVTAAATRLRLTQSAVSRIIAAVEAELGFALFERHHRRLIPGEHTLHFVARAAKIVDGMEELKASARAIRQGRIERLRVISVPPFLQGFCREQSRGASSPILETFGQCRYRTAGRHTGIGSTGGISISPSLASRSTVRRFACSPCRRSRLLPSCLGGTGWPSKGASVSKTFSSDRW